MTILGLRKKRGIQILFILNCYANFFYLLHKNFR